MSLIYSNITHANAHQSFAALDLVREYDQDPDVKIFHVSFGAPPIGTQRFREYFNSHFNTPARRHQSWAFYHEQDLVANCFAWCGSRWYLGWLGWWGDWRSVGKRVMLTTEAPPLPPLPAGQPQSGKIESYLSRVWTKFSKIIIWPILGSGVMFGMLLMYAASLIAIPVAGVRYWLPGCRREITNPPANWGTGRRPKDDPPIGVQLGLEYHSLHTYIGVMERDKFLTGAEIVE